MPTRIFFAFLFFASLAHSQTTNVDCSFAATLTGAGSSGTYDNRSKGCVYWAYSYTASGYSALTLALQDAPDSSGVPGTWVTFGGATVQGANPSTIVTSSFFVGTGYFPWLRMTLSGLTGSGSVTVLAVGCRAVSSCTLPAVPGGASSNVNIEEFGGTTVSIGQQNNANSIPVVLSNQQFGLLCTAHVAINVTGAGNTQIVAASGATTVTICGLILTSATAISAKLTYGTGANCVTGPADLTGTYQALTALVLNFPASSIATPASQAVCLNLGAGAIAVTGDLFYRQI